VVDIAEVSEITCRGIHLENVRDLKPLNELGDRKV
jgi:hypothetical protein